MTLHIFHLLGLAIGILAYAGLTVFCIVTWARRITGRAAFAAALSTLVFLIAQALTGISSLSFSLQVAALLAWMVLLARVIGIGQRTARNETFNPVTRLLLAGGLAGLATAGYAWLLAFRIAALPVKGLFIGEVLFAIAGLVLLEQVVRNTRDDLHWRLRYLNIGIGTLFVFQLVHGAAALMFNGYMPALVAVQPAIYALAVPFVVIASLRNPDNPLRLNLSRQFVFRSGVLVGTGILLLVLGILGYLVRLLDGNWVGAMLALATALALLAVVTIFGSSRVRQRGRRFIEEHLFPRKHDYREAWQRMTGLLTEPNPDFNLTQQVIRALGGVLHSPGGGIWRLSPEGILISIGHLQARWDTPFSPASSHRLKTYFEANDWVLDLNNRNESKDLSLAELPEIADMGGVRFVVPLMTDTRLFGIAVLKEPLVAQSLDWEDYDVLKLMARQAAGFVALREAEHELAEADKLNSFSQVSAFVVHDVKTIAAQLSLLVENAEKHKGNPAFVDDMISTVGNAVGRMHKLLDQFRGESTAAGEEVELSMILEQTLASFEYQTPTPTLQIGCSKPVVSADPGKLHSALGHLIQNAVDAANSASGSSQTAPEVCVTLQQHSPWLEITIQDNGPGMDQTFIDQALFQPFTSTKGVAGMGIGAYQARSYIRSLGGDISVRSHTGHGTTFTVRLPVRSADDRS